MIITHRFSDSKAGKELNKKKHKPAKDDGSKYHDNKQGNCVFDLGFSILSSY
jgi:hypothetical protein